jgi:nicotinate-nucleotide--dimethylbenzimidazole phosphoribosyltransferase
MQAMCPAQPVPEAVPTAIASASGLAVPRDFAATLLGAVSPAADPELGQSSTQAPGASAAPPTPAARPAATAAAPDAPVPEVPVPQDQAPAAVQSEDHDVTGQQAPPGARRDESEGARDDGSEAPRRVAPEAALMVAAALPPVATLPAAAQPPTPRVAPPPREPVGAAEPVPHHVAQAHAQGPIAGQRAQVAPAFVQLQTPETSRVAQPSVTAESPGVTLSSRSPVPAEASSQASAPDAPRPDAASESRAVPKSSVGAVTGEDGGDRTQAPASEGEDRPPSSPALGPAAGPRLTSADVSPVQTAQAISLQASAPAAQADTPRSAPPDRGEQGAASPDALAAPGPPAEPTSASVEGAGTSPPVPEGAAPEEHPGALGWARAPEAVPSAPPPARVVAGGLPAPRRTAAARASYRALSASDPSGQPILERPSDTRVGTPDIAAPEPPVQQALPAVSGEPRPAATQASAVPIPLQVTAEPSAGRFRPRGVTGAVVAAIGQDGELTQRAAALSARPAQAAPGRAVDGLSLPAGEAASQAPLQAVAMDTLTGMQTASDAAPPAVALAAGAIVAATVASPGSDRRSPSITPAPEASAQAVPSSAPAPAQVPPASPAAPVAAQPARVEDPAPVVAAEPGIAVIAPASTAADMSPAPAPMPDGGGASAVPRRLASREAAPLQEVPVSSRPAPQAPEAQPPEQAEEPGRIAMNATPDTSPMAVAQILAPASNGGAIEVRAEGVAVQAVRRVSELLHRPEARGEGRLEIRVDWADLGVERVSVEWQGDQARVDVRCHTEAAAAALAPTEGQLRERLASVGVELVELRTSCDTGGQRRPDDGGAQAWVAPQRWQGYGSAPTASRPTIPRPARRGGAGVDILA